MWVCARLSAEEYVLKAGCVRVKSLRAHACLYVFIGSVKTVIRVHNVPILTFEASSHDNKLSCPIARECSEPHFCLKESSAPEACWYAGRVVEAGI